MTKYFQSLRWKIQFWQLLFLSIITGGLLVGFYFYEKETRLRIVDLELLHVREPLFVKHIVLKTKHGKARGVKAVWPSHEREERWRREEFSEPELIEEGRRDKVHYDESGKPLPKIDEGKQLVETYGLYAKVWKLSGDVDFFGDPIGLDVPYPENEKGKDGHFFRWRDGHREMVFIGKRNEVIIVGKPNHSVFEDLHHFRNGLIGVGVGISIIAVFLGWFTSRHIVQPIRDIGRVATRISDGDLSERVPETDGGTELERLVRVLNISFGKLEQSVNQQVRFTADASHELRTPLAVILNESQWALETDRAPETYRESFSVCAKSAQHMRFLVESLLDLARIDSGEYHLSRYHFELKDVVCEVDELLTGLASQRSVFLVQEVGNHSLYADLSKIKQVILNLVSNAINHSHPGGSVKILSRAVGDTVEILIKDQGVGIAEEDIPYLFERFYTADKARGGIRGGTGLGLAISSAIVQAHGGAIRVDSQLGMGSSFIISLPTDSSDESS